jgi:DNA (cytosine-5)-methyltransferase 1
MTKHSVVSVFSGCGGLDLGFLEAGFELTYACDIDPAAVACYRSNLDDRAMCLDATSEAFHSDIRNIGECDIVIGGFPCQGFSKAGPKQKGDSRNTLYVEMRRVVEELNPKVFIAENVDGMSQNFGGAYLKQITADFSSLGYEVEHRVIDSVAYGVPQHRRRIIFVGTNGVDFHWPEPTHTAPSRNGEFRIGNQGPSLFDDAPQAVARARTIRDAIGNLPAPGKEIPDHVLIDSWPRKYEHVFSHIGPGQKLCNVRHSDTSVYTWQIPEVFGNTTARERCVLETISKNRRHKRYGAIPNGNPLPVAEIESLSGLAGIRPEIGTLLEKGYLKEIEGKHDLKGAMFCSGLFKRPRWDEPSPTVLTNFYNPRYFLHPEKNRPFTLRECARLQSFPDDFLFLDGEGAVDLISGYRLVGNAVPPLVSRAFADSVMASLPDNRTRRRHHEATSRSIESDHSPATGRV